MAIEIREVTSRKDLKTFIYLPEKIHAGHANWVHPIYMDDWKYFNRKKNKAYGYCDAVLLLAFRDGRPVGRATGIINRRYNEYRLEKTARFGYFEVFEDREAFRAILRHIEDWARAKGMTRIVGPYGFSDQDPEGFLIEGFDHRATLATYYNFEWMPQWLEEEGYAKDNDWFVYKLEVPKEPPEFYKKIYERARPAEGLRYRRVQDAQGDQALDPPRAQPHERDLRGREHLRLHPALGGGDGRPGQALPAGHRPALRQGHRQGRRRSWPSSSPCPT